MSTTANVDCGFESAAEKYAAYLETPEGRLRLDLAFLNLQEFLPLPPPGQHLQALDLGCGTGATGIRLARLGFYVTLVDCSPAMLEIAKRAAVQAGVADKISLKQTNAADVKHLVPIRGFDAVLCHNILEYAEDTGAVLRAAAQALRDSSAIVSVLVRNQAGEVLKAAIQRGDLAAAEESLSAEWGQESLYGGQVRLFTSDSLRTRLKAASLTITAERGVRVLADYLPAGISRVADYERILTLEHKLGRRPEFAAVARYRHYLARGEAPARGDVI